MKELVGDHRHWAGWRETSKGLEHFVEDCRWPGCRAEEDGNLGNADGQVADPSLFGRPSDRAPTR